MADKTTAPLEISPDLPGSLIRRFSRPSRFDHPCKEWSNVGKCPAGCRNTKPCPPGFYQSEPCGYCRIKPQFYCYPDRDLGKNVRRKGALGPEDPGCQPFIGHYAPEGGPYHAGTKARDYRMVVGGLWLATLGLLAGATYRLVQS